MKRRVKKENVMNRNSRGKTGAGEVEVGKKVLLISLLFFYRLFGLYALSLEDLQ